MAAFNTVGIDDLLDAFEDIMDIPDDVVLDMLNAEADVLVDAQKEEIGKTGLVDTGELRDSISRTRKLESKGTARYLEVYPQGTRKDGVKNAEVGFIHEYGAPHKHIKASGWMEKANEAHADEAVEKAADVHDSFLKSKKL